MVRNIAIAGFAAATLLGLAAQAQAQEIVPELDGGPGSHPAKAKHDTTAKQAQAAADKLKADRAKLAQQASAQDAEQARLAKQAQDLKAQQAKLDARAAELVAREKRLAQLRADEESDHAAKLAEIARQRQAADQQTAALRAEQKARPLTPPPIQPQAQLADASISPRSHDRLESHAPGGDGPIDITKPAIVDAPVANASAVADRQIAPDKPIVAERVAPEAPVVRAHLDLDAARRSCARAGEDAAMARRYYSARYDDAVRVYQDGGWKLRGRMRLEDRRGYLLIDTVCDVSIDGAAQHFAFLR